MWKIKVKGFRFIVFRSNLNSKVFKLNISSIACTYLIKMNYKKKAETGHTIQEQEEVQ